MSTIIFRKSTLRFASLALSCVYANSTFADNPFARKCPSSVYPKKSKYVGILFESDPANPDIYRIVDGQTGLPLTERQVRDFPATLTDMWKDQGLVCTASLTRQQQERLERLIAIDKAVNVAVETGKDIGNAAGTTVSDMKDWLSSILSSPNKTDYLKSIADLLETGEEIVEVREDIREDRRERKAKEQVERERKAAEEAERLRQQQLEEQRKKDAQRKKDSDNKQSDKKPDVKKDEPKKEMTKKKEPKPAQRGQEVDFTELESLISRQASLFRGILSSGKKASSAQRSQFNSLNNQYASEFNRLKAQIGNISDPAKRSQYYSKLASINSRINSEVDPLLAQGASRRLFTNL